MTPTRAENQLEFSDLTNYPVMAQALDNQWMPSSVAAKQQRSSAATGTPSDVLDTVRGELRRALVNSGTLVVNRAYFLNNPALYANYLPEADPAERRAFTGLLNSGVIVPYLLAEHSPEEEPSFPHERRVHRAWRRLLADDAEPACVRLSWDDEENRTAAEKVGLYFTRGIQSINRIDPLLLAEDLDLPVEEVRAMRSGILTDIAVWAAGQDPDRVILRNAVYQEFLARPGLPAHRQLLRAGRHIVPAKQLVDLLYNVGVPMAGGIIAVTPPQSPPRSALGELEAGSRSPVADPEALGLILRGVFADALHRAVDGPNSYASLTLSDVARLRREESWHAYVEALNGFIRTGFAAGQAPGPEAFALATAEIARLHARMLKKARKISRSGTGYQRDVAATLVLESPGIVLQTISGQHSLLTGSLEAVGVVAGPLVMRLVFKDRGSGDRGDLGHSITLPTLRLRNLRRDWETILRVYGGHLTQATGDAAPHQADQQALHA